MIVEKSPPKFPEKVIPKPLSQCDKCGSQLRKKSGNCICMKECPDCGCAGDDHDDDCEFAE